MTAFKHVTKWLLFCLFVLVVLGSCKMVAISSSTDGEERRNGTFYVKMLYFNFDIVDNLSLFFGSGSDA